MNMTFTSSKFPANTCGFFQWYTGVAQEPVFNGTDLKGLPSLNICPL